MESEGDHDFTEEQIAYKVGGITVTGTIDNYDMEHGVICDYKTASVNKIRFNDFNDWHTQGMIYAWLLTRNKFPVTKCRFIALLKDHSKTEAMRDSQYPADPVFIYEFPVTAQGLFKIGLLIKNKVSEYQQSTSVPDDEILPCTPAERWDKQPKFAVMKKGMKRAVRLFDKEKEAEHLANEKGDGHYVEFRQGESVRCRSYCLCRRFCNFYKNNAAKAVDTAIEKQAA
jgi:hypothetical protein